MIITIQYRRDDNYAVLAEPVGSWYLEGREQVIRKLKQIGIDESTSDFAVDYAYNFRIVYINTDGNRVLADSGLIFEENLL